MRTTMFAGLAAGMLCALLLHHHPTLRRTLDYAAAFIVTVVAGTLLTALRPSLHTTRH